MNRIAVGTRKGLLTLSQQGEDWTVLHESHMGARVPYAMSDPRSGFLYACLDHGHWGPKMQRSADGGQTWEEIPSPKYPDGAELQSSNPAVLRYQWCLVPSAED